MRGLILFGLLISTSIICVICDNVDLPGLTHSDTSAVANIESDELSHGHRSKRSPYDPLVPGILLGKSLFLLGAIYGKGLKGKGWGWRPRPSRGWGWGWKPAPVVQHVHSHGGWGGWDYEEPIIPQGYGWGWRR